MGRHPHHGIGILLTCLALLAGASLACGGDEPAPTLSALTATGEGRAMYPPFDPDVRHYAVGCGDGALTLTLSSADADTPLEVNGAGYPGRDAVVELTDLTGDSDVVIALGDGEKRATWTVHCLPDDFPTITARKMPGHSDILMAVAVARKYIAILDTNGVPRFHRGVGEHALNFKYHPDGRYPYSYFVRVEVENIPNYTDFNLWAQEAVVLGREFEVRDVVTVVPPLTHTDNHDFVIKPNGNYVLLSYDPARRDLSALRDPDGNPYSVIEGVEDSAIQEITPDREQVFLWNSWDHMAVAEDCRQHRFPADYAHVNSVRIVDGDFIASFRGCSQVLRIDGTSGDVVWRLGRSNRSDADWIASGSPAPLKIVGDPYGEFCGQHAARLLPNGNLVLFDNGAHCLVDPATGIPTRESGITRVVEYALNHETGQATFVRHHSLHGSFDHFAPIAGHVELLDNGNWLISWGRGGRGGNPPDATITEVDPLTGEELLSITFTDEDGVIDSRAHPVPPDALE